MTSDKRILKKLSLVKPLKLAVQVGLVCGLAVTGFNTAFAGTVEREQAKRIHDHLAGIPPTENMLCAMDWLITNAANGAEQAAYLVMSTNPASDSNIPDFASAQSNCGGSVDNSLSKKAFYSVSLKNFVTPWTNEDQTVHADLNDYSALVIGMIRDDVAFDTVLSADLLYKGANGLSNVAALTNDSNQHFADLQNEGYDLSDPNVLVKTKQTAVSGYLPANPTDSADVADPAGVTTTRAASLAFFTGGTNRLMWRMTAVNYLCRDMEQLKDVSRPPDRIRQDVSRSPGGDSSIYLSSCMGCHAGMDPLTGAYAYYDHEVLDDGTPTGHMLWKQNSVMFGGAQVTTGAGETLYNQNCTSCHDTPKTDSDQANMKSRINNAITNNIGGMNILASTLTDTDIGDIATFLVGGADRPVPVEVTEKNLINSGNFKYGYVTTDDQWTNYWREGPNSDIEWGWNPGARTVTHADGSTDTVNVPDSSYVIASGKGAASLGYEVTSSKAFAQCQVEKVFKFVCLRDPLSTEGGSTGAVENFTTAFHDSGYNMKTVFAKVAAQCMGQ